MKRILNFFFYILFPVITCSISAQVNTNQQVYNGIPGENPFFDASSNFSLSVDATSAGKGLLFPRTDLTTWQFNTGLLDGITFPTAFDGMIVFNVATGNTPTTGNNPTTSTTVTPGFYYFSNPTGTDHVNSGKWTRIADKNDLKTASGSTFPSSPSPGDVFYNTATKNFYYYKDTEWVAVSATPNGTTLPATSDAKVGDVYYLTSANPADNVLKIFDGTNWITVGGVLNGSITDTKLQATGGGALTAGIAGQILASAGSNQFKWIDAGATPSASVLPAVGAAGATFFNSATNSYFISDGTSWVPVGTVTSVGLTLPSFITVSGSPVKSAGTLTGTLASQNAGTVFAAPAAANGTPSFRSLQDTDVPGLANKVNTSAVGAASGVAPLDGSQKIPSIYLPDAILGSVTYKGTYDASSGTPTLATASALNKGHYYVVTVAGSVPMNVNVGDWVISNGSSWEKVNNSAAVSSVFGRTGTITANTGDYNTDQVPEGSTNKYYTDALANANPTLAGKEDVSNKVNTIIADATNTKYPTVDAVKTYVDTKVPTTGSNGQVLTVVSGNPAWANPSGVTSVSITSSNGITSSITNQTTTPAITLSLGAITPTSINTTGAITTTGTVTAGTLSGSLDASKLTGTIASARYGNNTIPVGAIQASGIAAGTYLDGSGHWSVPSGGSGTLPAITASDANKVLTVNALGNAATWVTPGSVTVPDATSSSKGILKLAGDLAGTADMPTVVSIGGILPSTSADPNTLVVRDASGIIPGNIDGNAATATSATSAVNVTGASQPNITSLPNVTTLGTLTNLSVINPIQGNITGNAATATTASTAATSSKVTVTDVASGTTVYPTWVTGSGDVPINISTGKLKYAPSTGTLTATTFNGTLDASNLTGTIAAARYGNNTIPLAALNAGTINSSGFLKGDGTWAIPTTNPGTVTSVGLSLPAIFTVTNSPVTASGILTATLASQTANTVLAAPDGSNGAPTFRSLSSADISDFVTKTTTIMNKGNANGVAPLDPSGKISSTYLPSSLAGAVVYKGTYDASSGSPSLPAASSSQGFYYVVSTAGSTPMALNVGDWVISNGTSWDRVSNGGSVGSVFGRTGAVVATTGDYTTDQITEGTKKFYSDALVSANATVVGKEDKANKSTDGTFATVDDTKYPSIKAVKTYVDGKVPTVGGNGQVLTIVSGNPAWVTPSSGSGTVSSVGLSLPSIFTVSNSPVTGTGTLTATLASQSAGYVLAAPAGSSGSPTFRALAASDIPTLNQNTTGNAATATTAVTVTGSAQPNITSVGTLTGLTVSSTISGSVSGSAGSALTTAITDDASPTAAVYPTWVSSNSGNLPQKVTSSKLSFIPSTGELTATSFNGNLNANNITTGTVAPARLGSGTPSASTYLRGDGTWAAASGSVSDATTSAKGIVMLAGDLGGTAASPSVVSVGGSTAAAVNTATVLANGATTAATANTLVKRDGSGNILNLNATYLTSGTVATARLGSGTADATTFLRGDGTWASASASDATTTAKGIVMLANDLSGTAAAPSVAYVGGATAANVRTGVDLANGATTLSTPNSLVKRDSNGKILNLDADQLVSGTILAARYGTGTIPVAAINTSGTASSSTFLRGDGTWAAPPGGSGSTLPTPTIPGDEGKVLTVDATTKVATWELPASGSGSSMVTYNPSGNTKFYCRASGTGVTVTLSGYTYTVNVPAGVWLDYLKIKSSYVEIGSQVNLDIVINYLGKEYNNNADMSDLMMPSIFMFDIPFTTNHNYNISSPYTTNCVWLLTAAQSGSITFHNQNMANHTNTSGDGFCLILHF